MLEKSDLSCPLSVHTMRIRPQTIKQHQIDKDRKSFLRSVTEAPLPKATRKRFEESWCLHRGFGACCDPQVFHLPGVWQKIRQNPLLYKVARKLIGRKDIWVDLNR